MKKQKIFLKLSKVIKTKKQCQLFIDMFITNIKQNKAITNNTLLDGFIIGLIYSNSGYVSGLIRNVDLPPMSDNNIQQLEQITYYILNNEKTLVKLYNEYVSLLKPL